VDRADLQVLVSNLSYAQRLVYEAVMVEVTGQASLASKMATHGAADPLANVEGAAEQIAHFQTLKTVFQAGRISYEGAMARVLRRINGDVYDAATSEQLRQLAIQVTPL
jgi:DNA-directed RNA polymerase alpha subunit